MPPSRRPLPARRRAARLALLAAAALAALALAAPLRLLLGPVDVAFLAGPLVERALRGRGGGVEVLLGGAEASWDGGIRLRARDVRAVPRGGGVEVLLGEAEASWDGRIRLRARDVRAVPRGGGAPAAAAALVDARFRLAGLLRGRPAPDEVRIDSPRLALVRGAGGSLRLEGWTGASAALPAPGPGIPRIAFRDGRVDVRDEAAGAPWAARGVEGSLAPGPDGWEARADGAVSLGGGPPARVGLRASAGRDLREWSAEARFRDLVPDAFAAALPAAAGLRVPLEGTLRAGSGPDGPAAALEAGGRGGSLVFPHPALDGGADSLPVERAALRVRLDPATGGISIEEARVEGAGYALRAEGGIAGLGAGAGEIDVRLEGGVPARDLAGWLRGGLGRAAADWFDGSLLAGDVAGAEVRIRLPEGWGGPVAMAMDARLERAELRWQDGAPPLAMDEARVVLDGRRLEVTSAAGEAGPGSLSRLRFDAPDILAPDGGGRFTAVVRGDAGRLLETVEVEAGAGGPGLLSGPVEADLEIAVPFGDPEGTEVRLDGAFRGLALRPGFLAGPLAGIGLRDLVGTLDYGPGGVVIRADGRTDDGLAVSRIEIDAPALEGGRARVRGTAAGDARRLLALGAALLGGDRENLPVAPAGVQGRAEMRFAVSAPVAGAGAVEVESAEGTFAGVRLAPGALAGPFGRVGVDALGGSLSFRPGWLTVQGSGLFAGSGFEFSWRDRSGADGRGGFRQALAVRGVFDGAAREAAGVAVPGVEGPAAVRASLVRAPGADAWRLGVDADLGRALLRVAPLGWQKAVGSPFAARLSGELGEGPADLALLVRGERAQVRGTLRMDADGRFRGAEFDRFEFGENRLAGAIEVAPDGTAEMRLAGERIDLHEALRADAPGPSLPVRLELAAREALVGGPEPVGPLALDFEADRAGVREVRAFLGLPDRQVARLEARREGGTLALTAEGSDAGVAARAFGLGESLREGRFRIEAARDENDPERPVEGSVALEGFRLVDAPVLARLLQVATFTGIFESLVGGEGIRFFGFEGDFALRNRVLTVRDGLARGFSLGLKFDAELDLHADTIEAEGVLIPAYAIGEIFTRIPILGKILGGIRGDGVVAVEFRVQGPSGDPGVSAAPLTLLLPGVLRDILGPLFGGGGTLRGGPAEPPPAVNGPGG